MHGTRWPCSAITPQWAKPKTLEEESWVMMTDEGLGSRWCWTLVCWREREREWSLLRWLEGQREREREGECVCGCYLIRDVVPAVVYSLVRSAIRQKHSLQIHCQLNRLATCTKPEKYFLTYTLETCICRRGISFSMSLHLWCFSLTHPLTNQAMAARWYKVMRSAPFHTQVHTTHDSLHT